VGGVAVDLDDEPLLLPQGVDAPRAELSIEHRSG
jgi:hypothetical protein